MKNVLKIVSLIVICSFSVSAQERFGIYTSQYAGLNGCFINPALSMTSPYQLDVNFGTGALNVDNHFLAFQQKKLFDNFLYYSDEPMKFIQDKASFNVDALLKYPSIAVRFKNVAAGFYANTRINVTTENIPTSMFTDIIRGYDAAKIGTFRTLPYFNGVGMKWNELGFNGSAIVSQFKKDQIDLGANVKYLFNAQAYGLRTEEIVYKYTSDTSITIGKLNAKAFFPGEKYGRGFAFDFGVNWTKQESGPSFVALNENEKKKYDKNYLFKAGISIIDAGFARFRYGQIKDIKVSNLGVPVLNLGSMNTMQLDSVIFGNLADTLEKSNDQNNGNTTITNTGNYEVRLPTAISMQFDYRIMKNFYLYSNFTYGLSTKNGLGLKRQSQLCVAPRFQTKDVDIVLPVSLYNFSTIRAGLAVRFKGFEIGMDQLVSYNKDIPYRKGFDIYASVKLSIEELEHTFLKPNKIDTGGVYDVGGYLAKQSVRPASNTKTYYSARPDDESFLFVKNIKTGEVVDSLFIFTKAQKTFFLMPWRFGYRYKPGKNYKPKKDLRPGIYTVEKRFPLIVNAPNGSPADIVILIPTNTYAALNTAGGKGLQESKKKNKKPANRVSFNRPLNDSSYLKLGELADFIDKHQHWKISYISDKDMDSYKNLKGAKLLIVAGNSEYWTRKARENYDKYVKQGGNVVLFSENLMKYQARYSKKGDKLICYKARNKDHFTGKSTKTGLWKDKKLKYPLPDHLDIKPDDLKDVKADSSNLERKLFEESKLKIIDGKRTAAGRIVLEQLNYSPENLYIINTEGLTPVIVTREKPGYGLVYNFYTSERLRLFETDRMYLDAIIKQSIKTNP